MRTSIFPNDDWTLAEAEGDAGPFIVRVRSGLPSSADQALFCQLVIIKWAYESDESGMPQAEEFERMRGFEDAIEAGTEARLVAVQVVSFTGRGEKEWRYYTPDTDAFMQSLNEDLAEHDAYPLQFESFLDAEWDALREVQGKLREPEDT
jgi:hypothetical protein